VALNALLGVQFVLWVRYFELGGGGLYASRPAGAEGWLPIAGLMNFKYLLLTRRMPSIHPASIFLFVSFLLTSLPLKHAAGIRCNQRAKSCWQLRVSIQYCLLLKTPNCP